MKVAYQSNSTRKFNARFMWIIGIGFSHNFLNIDKYNILESIVIYIPFCRIDITQYFQKEV